jgi:hypothetical protein
VGLERCSHIPGQQILDLADGMIGDLRQHGAQIEFRIESLSLAEPIRVYMTAARWPPQSDPAKRKFFRPRATALSARSAALLCVP